MSFDTTRINYEQYFRCVSIPFEQGDVFRLKSLKEVRELVWSQSLSSRAMSFDLANELKQDCTLLSLNPFRAGRCLSTNKSVIGSPSIFVSIPFEQGDVFRLQRYAGGRNHAAFQTHFPIFLEG